MIDYFVANFNMPTFLMTIGLFFLLTNIATFIFRIYLHRKAKKRVKRAEAKHADLSAKFSAKQQEIDKLLGKKETGK